MNPLWPSIAGLALVAGAIAYWKSRSTARRTSSNQFDLTEEDLARLPDAIVLRALSPVPELDVAADELCQQGFEDAGAFALEGIPRITVRLLAHPGLAMYAVIWHHARAGSWIDVSTQYPGGDKCTSTTLCGAGLEGRPGHTIVRLPGMRPVDLFLRHSSDRPIGMRKPATVEQAAADFENAYLVWRSWRRAQEHSQRAA